MDFSMLQEWFFFVPKDNPYGFLLELCGFVTGVLAVYLIAKERVIGWPIGIVNCVIYIYVYWQHQFVSDAALFVYFLITQFYGWAIWAKSRKSGKAVDEIEVLTLGERASLWWFAGTAVSIFIWGAMVIWLAKSGLVTQWFGLEFAPQLPWHDAATTVVQIVAQYLMAKRYIESWVLWIAVDILAPLNYLEKGLNMTAVLFLVYLVLAVIGFMKWLRTLEKQKVARASRP